MQAYLYKFASTPHDTSVLEQLKYGIVTMDEEDALALPIIVIVLKQKEKRKPVNLGVKTDF